MYSKYSIFLNYINMNITKTLSNELSITLERGEEEVLIDCKQGIQKIVMAVKTTNSCQMRTTIDSASIVNSLSYDEINWETPIINGVETSEFTSDLGSEVFYAPSVIYLKNGATGTSRFSFKTLN